MFFYGSGIMRNLVKGVFCVGIWMIGGVKGVSVGRMALAPVCDYSSSDEIGMSTEIISLKDTFFNRLNDVVLVFLDGKGTQGIGGAIIDLIREISQTGIDKSEILKEIEYITLPKYGKRASDLYHKIELVLSQ
jgi:hypothetical protein